MNHLTEDQLTLLFYDELGGAEVRRARAHLESCPSCQAEEAKLRQFFQVINKYPVPEPPAGFERDVWRRLQPAFRAGQVEHATRTPSLAARVREWFVPSRGLALGGAMAALVLVAFVMGRYWQSDRGGRAVPATTTVGSQETLRERVLLTALGEHFDRSRAILVDLAGTAPAGTVDISGEQRRAHDLLAATRIYRRAAAEAGDRTVGDVLEALERVLVEVEVSPSQLSAYELRTLQKRIDEQELLFKMRVASAGVREREQSTRPAAAVLRSAGA